MVKYMIIGFDAFVNKVIKASGEKCKHVVYASYSDKIVLIFFLYMFYTSYTFNMITYSSYPLVFLVLYILITIFVVFMLTSRKIGFGMTDSRFIYVKFKHIGFKPRQIYDIVFDNIKRVDLRKFMGVTYVKLSFIDETGRLKRIKFRYSPTVLGLDKTQQKSNGIEIYNKLRELEKVLDRGDF